MTQRKVPTVLSIAGSDSGGGAGIQADLKAIARCGAHGMTAITSLTAQSTVGVTRIHPVPTAMIVEQVRVVAADLGVDAVKIGMLGTREATEAVIEALSALGAGTPVVIDPVMGAESGASLLDEDARQALVEGLFPLATVVTPNIPEARLLAACGDRAEQPELARAISALGPANVVVTGGHSPRLVDLFFDGERMTEIDGERHEGAASHGSGCTHSSALASYLALGLDPLAAARSARGVASEAVANGLTGLGAGPGPVDVFGLTGAAEPD